MATGIIPAPPTEPIQPIVKKIDSDTTGTQTVAANSYQNVAVTFGSAFPDTNYLVMLTMQSNQTSGGYGQISFSFHSKTKNGFSIRIFNGSGSSKTVVVTWIAMAV